MKIKTQIFTVGIVSSILPLVAVSAMLMSVYNKELNRIIESDLRSVTTAQIDIVDQFFYERNSNMAVLSAYQMLHTLLEDSNAGRDTLRTPEKIALQHIFDAQKSMQGFLYSITAIDMSGHIVISTEPTKPGEVSNLGTVEDLDALGREARFSRIMEKGEYGTRERCLVATRAIYGENDQRMGYLVEEIALDFVEDMRISTDIVKDGYIYITDGEGGLITAGSGDNQRKDFVLEESDRGTFSQAWAERDLSQPVGVISYDVSGKKYLSGYGGFTNANWQILSSVCVDNILHTKENISNVLLVSLLVALLLIATVEIIMHQTLSNPIERMLLTFAQIRKYHDFGIRIENVPNNELGVVATEVNGLLVDIERTIRHHQEKLRIFKERAERDPFTQLFNKSAIKEVINYKIESACVNKCPLVCVMVDIDDFKEFNTRYGHAGGDAVIRFVADLMKDFSCDTAGRIGGDEFVMCLDSLADQGQVADCLEKFLSKLRNGADLVQDGCLIPISCSIGVTLMQTRTEPSCDVLLQTADKAMYEVKNTTKNGYKMLIEE